MRVLKKKMKEYARRGNGKSEDKMEAVEELKEKLKKRRKGQYTEQDELKDVRDHRYSIDKEAMYHKSEMEDEDEQPKFKKNPSKEDVKRHRTNSHKRASEVEPPDEEMMEEYPPANTENKQGKGLSKKLEKDDKKKLAVLIIGKKMKKRK